MFHGILFNKQFENKLKYVSLLKPYFLYIFIADILIMNTLYRVKKGKWLFAELDFKYNRPDPVIVDPTENQERVLNNNMSQQIPINDPEIPEYVPPNDEKKTKDKSNNKTQHTNEHVNTAKKIKAVEKKPVVKKPVEKKKIDKNQLPKSKNSIPKRRTPHVTTPTDNSKDTSKILLTKQKKNDEIEIDLNSDSSDSEKIVKSKKTKKN